MQITFWGAAQTVTGSMYEVRVDGRRFLLDCGTYQGRRREAHERNKNLPFPPAEVDAVVLQPEVPIFGDPERLRAEVVKLNELSGHADQRELLVWMKPLVPRLRRVFLVHGEPTQLNALAPAIREQYELDVVVPSRGETFYLTGD